MQTSDLCEIVFNSSPREIYLFVMHPFMKYSDAAASQSTKSYAARAIGAYFPNLPVCFGFQIWLKNSVNEHIVGTIIISVCIAAPYVASSPHSSSSSSDHVKSQVAGWSINQNKSMNEIYLWVDEMGGMRGMREAIRRQRRSDGKAKCDFCTHWKCERCLSTRCVAWILAGWECGWDCVREGIFDWV